MKIRKAANRPPGGWDALHLFDQPIFESSNEWGIPDLLPAVGPPDNAKWYSYRDVGTPPDDLACLHCFTDDYRFESTWTHLAASKKRVTRFKFAVAPDFSQFVGWPSAARLWQCYRSAWVARLWQSYGLDVIPAPNWTGESFEPWQFAGMSNGSPVAVAVPDLRNRAVYARFVRGFRWMLEIVRPSKIYIVGKLPASLSVDCSVVYISKWSDRFSLLPSPAPRSPSLFLPPPSLSEV